MAGGVTDWGSAAWASALFGVTSVPSTYYIALVDSEPGVSSDGDTIADAEPDGAAGYARIAYASGGAHWAVSGQHLFSVLDIDFGTPVADWGLLPYYALCDAATSGHVYAWGRFDNPIYVTSDNDMSITAGGIVIGLATLDVPIAL